MPEQDDKPKLPLDTRLIDATVSCPHCMEQPDEVFYSRSEHVLFYECPNGHREYIEEFTYLG
jgi:hypothetical protein